VRGEHPHAQFTIQSTHLVIPCLVISSLPLLVFVLFPLARSRCCSSLLCSHHSLFVTITISTFTTSTWCLIDSAQPIQLRQKQSSKRKPASSKLKASLFVPCTRHPTQHHNPTTPHTQCLPAEFSRALARSPPKATSSAHSHPQPHYAALPPSQTSRPKE